MNKAPNGSEQDRTHFCVNIAGLEAEIHTVYESTYFFCQEYLSDGVPLIKVEVTQDDIQQEIDEGKGNFFTCVEYDGKQKKHVNVEKTVKESRIETAVVYRKLIEAALVYNIIFMHGAVISVHNKGIMFTAPSGTGKTTHMMKWLQNLDEAFVVNGDKPLVKIQDNEITAYGTPWCGKEKLATNTMVPLKSVVLMERSEENHIEEISFGKAYPFLLQQTYIPHDPDKAKKTLALLANLKNQVRIYRFQFNNFADDCFETAYNTLIGTL